MCDSKAEEDHLPMILIADIEIPHSAAVVATPILKEWAVYRERGIDAALITVNE